ncbi:hypothetical protein [Zoogloea sp.]|uniref:hypothetical protein n=1 Tax=Zoogloea sp. TaxID=49181 RepID=UPI003220121C
MTRTNADQTDQLCLKSGDGRLKYVIRLHRDGRTVLIDRVELRAGIPFEEEGAGFRSVKAFEDWASNEDARFSQLLLMKQLRETVCGLFAPSI